MQIHGFKCFNEGLINRYNRRYELKKTYKVFGEIKFGNDGNGFHFCKNLEDTLRYFDSFNNKVEIAEVIGSGDIQIFNDEYYGYYDMYVSKKIKLIKVLTRKEIFDIIENKPDYAITRFISGYKLTPNELAYFKNKYKDNINVLNAIIYYYEDNTIYENIKCKRNY